MRRVIAVPLLLFLAAFGRGQTREFTGGHLDKPPVLDGKVDAEEYKDAIHFDGLLDDETGGIAPEGGFFYLAYDAQFVYFAARLVDRQPSAIQATEFRTNVSLEGNDTVGLVLDPFGKLADFSSFEMNARGATSLKIAGGRAAKREWLGDFAATGRITSGGWEVEARIPWSVLRLPGKGPHDLRFNVFRNHRRLQRTYTWARTSNGLVQNNGYWKAVDLPAAVAPTLQLLPYFYGGVDQKNGIVANSGLDLRYPLTPELDLVGTLNPDFRNVERGVLSLDFSYFERLAGETRPFFLEGSDYFGGFNGSGGSDAASIFVPQRIGNFDLGAKVFGKLDPRTDFGALVTEDFGKQDAVVARFRRQLDPRTSWAFQYAGGGDATETRNPDAPNSRRNDAISTGYSHGVGSWNFSGNLLATEDDALGGGHRVGASASYFHDRTFSTLRYSETSKDFSPALGYAPQKDLRGFSGYVSQGFADPKKGLLQYGAEGGYVYQRSYDLSRPFHEGVSAYPYLVLRDGFHTFLELSWDRYFGGSSDQTYGIFIDRPQGDPYRNWSVSYESGTRNFQAYRNLGAGFAYRPLAMLQLNANYQKTTQEGLSLEQEIVSANYDLDQYHSIGGRLVSGPGISNFYVSLRQSGNRGAEYYLILGDPNAPRFRASLILKAVFPLGVKT